MRRIIYALLLALCLFSFSFAQGSDSDESTEAEPAEEYIIEGTVASMEYFYMGSDAPGRIAVVDERGQKLVFVVPRKAIIGDEKGETIPFNRVKKGNEVILKYTADSRNVKTAKYIELQNSD